MHILPRSSLTAQIDVTVNAPEAGTITQWFVSEEDNVEVGQKLCEIDTEGKSSGEGMFFIYICFDPSHY